MMKLSADQSKAIEKLASQMKIEFLRLFGSAIKNDKKARDVDIIVDESVDSVEKISLLNAGLEKIFKKPIDIVVLKSGLSPALVREINRDSISVFEKPKTGLIAYVDMIDRLLAIAEDDLLSFPEELRKKSREQVRKKLRVS